MPRNSQSQSQAHSHGHAQSEMQTLVVRVVSLKDLEGDFVLSLDKDRGHVSVYCDAFEDRQEIESLSPLHGLKKGTDLHWSNSSNTLSWTQSVHAFQELKATQPTLKFHVAVEAPSNTNNRASKSAEGDQTTHRQTQDCGFFLLDLRNVPHEEEEGEPWQQRWQVSQSQSRSQQLQQDIKVNQMHGVSVLISAVLLTPSTHSSTHAADSHSQSHGHRHHKRNPQDVRASSASSVSVAASVIALPPRYDLEAASSAHPGGSLVRYTLSLSVTATRHLQQLVHRQIHSNSNISNNLPTPPLCWFSWSILDITLQSAEFDPSSSSGRNSLEPATDSLFFECSEVAMLNLLEELGAMRVFLCSPGAILGVAEIPLPQQLNHLPFQKEQGWFSLQALSPEGGGQGGEDQPAVQLAFDVRATEPAASPARGRGSGQREVAGGQEDDTELCSDDEGGYDDDSFQQEEGGEEDEEDVGETGAGGRMSTQSHPLLLLKGKSSAGQANPEEYPHEEEDAEAEARERDAGEFEERRMRLCVQVKSLRPLHRPVRASMQFAYPHLGTGTGQAVRTHTSWSEPNVETTVDGAAASFECSMTSHRLQEIFKKELFVIQVLSRSHLGVTKFGDASVNLSKLYAHAPHSYICPLTQKAFKTLAQYRHHRQLMIALHSARKVDHVPAYFPISLKTLDTYLPVLLSVSNKGVEIVGKVRVLLTLEDFGPGGSSIDHMQQRTTAPSRMSSSGGGGGGGGGAGGDSEGQGATQSQSPGDGGVFAAQRLEWERWRQSEEEQWTAALRDKEQRLRQRLEGEAADSLSQRADDLKRAQEEVGRLEVRLRASIDLVERQKAQLELKEEQMSARLAQKTSELELLQRRVREEAKAKIEAETRRAVSLEAEVVMLQEQNARITKRAETAEKEYEIYKTHVRSMPETSLREEGSRLKAQLGELRTEIERERRLRGETELEKEHYRSQMHRIAIALKREREKSSAIARQELEQLRLEFLSREERYVLDGDRDELRTIRRELSGLRNQEAASVQHTHRNRNRSSDSGRHHDDHRHGDAAPPSSHLSKKSIEKMQFREVGGTDGGNGSGSQLEKLHRVSELRRELLSSELYSPGDPVIAQLDSTIQQAELALAQVGAAEDK